LANLPYIQALSLLTQEISLSNVPQVAILDTTDDINEFSLDNFEGIITYDKEGAARKFAYMIAPQVGRKNICKNFVPNFRCWLQKKAVGEEEFENVPRTNVLINVNTVRETKDVIILSGLITLEKDDELRIMVSSNTSDEVQLESIPIAGEPTIRCIIVLIFNIGLEKDEPIEPAKIQKAK